MTHRMDAGPLPRVALPSADDAGWWTGTGHSSSTFPGWAVAEALHRATSGRTPSYAVVNVRADLDLDEVRAAAAGPGRLFPVAVRPMPMHVPLAADVSHWPTVTVTAVGGVDDRILTFSGVDAPVA